MWVLCDQRLKIKDIALGLLKIGYSFRNSPLPVSCLPSQSLVFGDSGIMSVFTTTDSDFPGGGHAPAPLDRSAAGEKHAMRTTGVETHAAQQFCPSEATSYLHPQIEVIMSENIKYISDASFEQDVLKSDKPVLVDFWAEWCGPCKMIAPILEEIAKEYEGKLQIAKMDVDANQAVPAKFGIRGIPTLILFKNGVPAAQKVGAMAKGQLTAFIDSNI